MWPKRHVGPAPQGCCDSAKEIAVQFSLQAFARNGEPSVRQSQLPTPHHPFQHAFQVCYPRLLPPSILCTLNSAGGSRTDSPSRHVFQFCSTLLCSPFPSDRASLCVSARSLARSVRSCSVAFSCLSSLRLSGASGAFTTLESHLLSSDLRLSFYTVKPSHLFSSILVFPSHAQL